MNPLERNPARIRRALGRLQRLRDVEFVVVPDRVFAEYKLWLTTMAEQTFAESEAYRLQVGDEAYYARDEEGAYLDQEAPRRVDVRFRGLGIDAENLIYYGVPMVSRSEARRTGLR